jgi:putative component of membrane protein insertase Oxa1/YidC/SpoIIIJ protein YidD
MLIRGYQRWLSKHSGRTCLFNPTCSHVALKFLHDLGWNQGIQEIGRQLDRCGGSFTFAVSVSGNVTMTASDGMQFSANELSARMRSSLSTTLIASECFGL